MIRSLLEYLEGHADSLTLRVNPTIHNIIIGFHSYQKLIQNGMSMCITFFCYYYIIFLFFLLHY